MTDIDIFPEDEIIRDAKAAEAEVATATGGGGTGRTATEISLGDFPEDAYLTKAEMCRAFNCSERTLQRMVERFEIPPPMPLAGRKVWIVGKLRAWIAAAADRQEADAIKEAKRMKIIP